MIITVLDDYHGALAGSPHLAALRNRPEVEAIRFLTEPAPSEAALAASLADVEAVVAIRERTRFTRSLLERLPRLRFIAQTGGHAYHIDLAAATEHGVAVGLERSPAGGSSSTAELTLGLLLAVMRGIARYDALLHQGGWAVPDGRVLAGKTLGVLGFGKVGAEVARLGAAFRMTVLAWSPSLTPERAAGQGAQAVPLPELLQRADAISVHLALSADTRGFLNADRLATVKPGAILINTSRGPIVDEAALLDALQSGRLGGAGLDVFDQEPLPVDHPLRRLPTVVLTPHAGWPTDATYEIFGRIAAGLLEDYLEGRPDRVLNPAALRRR